MGMWSVGLGAVGAAIFGIILANTDLLLSNPEMANVEFLADADLKSTTDGNERVWCSITQMAYCTTHLLQ